MPTVLIAEDDPLIADTISNALIGAGYEVCGVASTVANGIALGCAHHPDLAVIDMQLAHNEDGREIVARLRGNGRIGVLYMSEYIDPAIELAPGDACIAKPCEISALLCALKIVAAGQRSQSRKAAAWSETGTWMRCLTYSTIRWSAEGSMVKPERSRAFDSCSLIL